MRHIGRSKIGKVTPKPNIIYPFARLPQECEEIIGKNVGIYETEYQGKRAFLLVIDDDTTLPTKVTQSSDITNTEKRLSELENDIKEIKEAILNKSPQVIEETLKGLRPGRNSNPSRLRDRQS
jgi:hypothetical protein